MDLSSSEARCGFDPGSERGEPADDHASAESEDALDGDALHPPQHQRSGSGHDEGLGVTGRSVGGLGGPYHAKVIPFLRSRRAK